MSWLLAALLLVRIGTRSAARRDADEAHRNLARLVADVGATHASPLRERAMTAIPDNLDV